MGDAPRTRTAYGTVRPPLTLDERGLSLDGVRVADLAARFGTPLYAYSGALIDRAYRAMEAALAGGTTLIAYAVKANSALAILSRLRALGAGADIVSVGELERALRAGFAADRIVFSGVGKRDDEIARALEVGVRSIHLESEAEAEVVAAVARAQGRRAQVSIRVNPDVDPKTHPYISTGIHGTKFGLEPAAALALGRRIMGNDALRLEGLAAHIGSQVSDAGAMREAVASVGGLWRTLRGEGAPLKALDAGGGWPIVYRGAAVDPVESARAMAAAVHGGLADAGVARGDVELVVEPGRFLVGAAGVLLARVLFVKEQPERRFVVVDAAMNDLLRPALYGAHHDIFVDAPAPQAVAGPADIVGPVCETGDYLALEREFPAVARGAVVAVADAGAYGMSMASQYNSRPRAAEVLVESGEARVIRDRETVDDLLRRERA